MKEKMYRYLKETKYQDYDSKVNNLEKLLEAKKEEFKNCYKQKKGGYDLMTCDPIKDQGTELKFQIESGKKIVIIKKAAYNALE